MAKENEVTSFNRVVGNNQHERLFESDTFVTVNGQRGIINYGYWNPSINDYLYQVSFPDGTESYIEEETLKKNGN